MNDQEYSAADCRTCQSHLPDLLLEADFAATHPELEKHLADCVGCRTELAELRSTFALLDEFTAPEPSPYFDSKLHARLREAQAAGPEGFWERLRAFSMFSTGRSFQPMLAGALGVLLLLGGGGAFLGLHDAHSGVASNAPAAVAPAVNDLKILDNNAQAEQQMGPLLDQSGAEDGESSPTT